MSDNQDIKPVITPQGTVKVEGQTSMVRLASFRVPRDLTLGGTNAARRGGLSLNAAARGKRTFTPNLNVQRNKPKEETKVKEEPTRRDRNARGQSSRARGDRGRGRNIIQSTGVFAEGMGSNDYKSNRPRFGGGGGGDAGASEAVILKPKVDFKATLKADAKEEDAALKLLLRDDFIDDPEADAPRIAPIQLPVSSKALTAGKAVVKKEEIKEEVTRNGISVAGVKIKTEPVDDDTSINDVSYADKDLEDKKGFFDFLCKKEPEFILLQLPDCLPGLRPSTEPDHPKQVQATTAGTSTDKGQPQQQQQQQQQCTLSSLSESQLGKIELLRSGAARLRIGELTFPLSLGTQAGFRQDVVAVELDETSKNGNMLNLGSIQNRMIAPPDWDALLYRRFVGKHDSSADSLLYQMSRP